MKRRRLDVRETELSHELVYTYNDRVQAIIPLPNEVLRDGYKLAEEFNAAEPDV